jgi:hypothetical protein
MPDIVIDDPKYIKLNATQKGLIQSIVKPEAEALRAFMYNGVLTELSYLDNKHKASTYIKIRELLQTPDIVQDDIIDLIKLLGIQEVVDVSDLSMPSQICEDELGFDCTAFEWTIRCVNESRTAAAGAAGGGGRPSRLKSKTRGYPTLQKALPRIKRKSKKKKSKKKKSKSHRKRR